MKTTNTGNTATQGTVCVSGICSENQAHTRFLSLSRCDARQAHQSDSEATNLDLAVVDLGLDSAGVLTVDGAADGDSGSENLLHGA